MTRLRPFPKLDDGPSLLVTPRSWRGRGAAFGGRLLDLHRLHLGQSGMLFQGISLGLQVPIGKVELRETSSHSFFGPIVPSAGQDGIIHGSKAIVDRFLPCLKVRI